MSHILTLVASDAAHGLSTPLIEQVQALCVKHEIRQICAPVWLSPDKAADIGVSGSLPGELVQKLRDLLDEEKTDFFINPIEHRQKRLLLADMDSTIVTGETLDELAAYAGLKDLISAITARAMNGELDFKEALRERVRLLKGLPVKTLDETLAETRLSPGAEVFVKTMAHNGAKCVLVSGGFTVFTEAIAAQAGFHTHHGNTLSTRHEALSGEVIDPILDKNAKLNFLRHYTLTSGLNPDQTLSIGDGANDLPMLKAAGLGIGYHPKDTVKNEIPNCILHGDLTAALYAQGYTDKHFWQS